MGTKSAITRFMKYVSPEPNSGCWLWSGPSRSNYGYGRIAIHGRVWMSHRYSYFAHKGPIPVGAIVMHTCDCVACVNPDHLKLGTVAENNKDAASKGRTSKGKLHSDKILPTVARGASNSATKVSESDVVNIRNAVGWSQRALAKQYGISQQAIFNILHKISWRWVK